MSEKKQYAEHFLASAEAIWGMAKIEPIAQNILKTGEAVWDVNQVQVEPGDEPATKPHPSKETLR